MSTAKWVENIRETLDSLDMWDIPEGHRKTVHRCLMSEYIEALDRWDEKEGTERSGKKWTEEEMDALKDVLDGKVASNWAEERVNVAMASAKVHRRDKTVKKKAIEMGLARAVDWWFNNREG